MTQATVTPEQIGEQVLVIRLRGEVDLANAEEVSDALLAHVSNVVMAVVVDLSAVGYLDSSGIQMLFDLAESLTRRQQELRVVVPGDAVLREVLELVRFDQLAPLDRALDDALAGVRATA